MLTFQRLRDLAREQETMTDPPDMEMAMAATAVVHALVEWVAVTLPPESQQAAADAVAKALGIE